MGIDQTVESYNSPGIQSPPTGHRTAYGKGIMDNYIREEIAHRIFIHGSPSIQISYVSKILILDKEELVLDKEREILLPNHEIIFPKIKEKFEYKTETLPLRERYATSTGLIPFLIFSTPFADLIIGEVANTPPPNPLCVLQSLHHVADAPKVGRSR